MVLQRGDESSSGRAETSSALANFMSELADLRRPVSASKLVQFSDLGPRAIGTFGEGWVEIPETRRLDLVLKLIDLTEDNVALNFAEVFKHLLTDGDYQIRAKAIAGLWEFQERSLIDPLVRLLMDDPEEAVRAAAAQALGRFIMLAETGKLSARDEERVATTLFDIVEGGEEAVEVRRRAFESLAPLSDERVPDLIREAYESDLPGMRASAVYAMGLTCDSDWLPLLLEEADSDDPEMRYEAAVALGEVGEEETAHRLGQLMHDEDAMVQAAAITALGNIGGPAAKRILNMALESEDAHIVELADAALKAAEVDDEPLQYHGFERTGP